MNSTQGESPYRWYLLFLATLTNTVVAALPSMCMPVLFNEISADLHLDLVQIGLIWGISSLPGILTVLVGGAVGDRFGPKRILAASCLLVGLMGALRGMATGFNTLAAAMLLFGVFSPFITMNSMKTCGTWFSSRQLGLASGVLSMGMALGFLAGSMLSATVLSPWLGGWWHVLYLYGAMAAALSIPWFFSRAAPAGGHPAHVSVGQGSLRRNLGYVARIRNVWLYGLTIFGINGCIQGTLGYLSLYLRGIGWPGIQADGALSAFHLISMIFVIPIALISDRLGSRKKVLLAATLMIAMGVGMLSAAGGILVWVSVLLAGMVRDGFMAVFMTLIVETEGIGPAYSGTALGLVMVFSGVGSVLAPPLGNSLGVIDPRLPFVLWAALTLFGFIGLLAASEKRGSPVLAVE